MTSEEAEPKPKSKPKRLDWRFPQIRRRRQFIDALAGSYDPEVACATSGLDWPAVCRLRRLYPEFAAEFDEVIAAGYDRLEMQLLRQAGAGAAGTGDKAGRELAAALLKQRRALRSEKEAALRRVAGASAGGRGSARSREQLVQAVKAQLAPLRAAAAAQAAARGELEHGETKQRGFGRCVAEPVG